MSSYQESSNPVALLVATGVATEGSIGPLHLAVMGALGQDAPTYPRNRLIGRKWESTLNSCAAIQRWPQTRRLKSVMQLPPNIALGFRTFGGQWCTCARSPSLV
jgi:hypothetical protein